MAARCPAGHELAWPLGGRPCPRCRREKVVAAVAAADPSLPRAVIEAAVDAAVPGGQALRQLADALAADRAVLTAGAPPVAGRLALELIARGSAALTIPACTACGRTGKPLFRGDGGAVCQRCRAWQLARPCATCGKAKPAAGFDEHGQAVCEVCRRRDDPRRHRECGRCGKTAPVAARGRDGQPGICVNCYFFSSRRRHTSCGRDWSSDVCSSDLADHRSNKSGYDKTGPGRLPDLLDLWSARRLKEAGADCVKILLYYTPDDPKQVNETKHAWEIGRASCRERGEIAGVADGLKTKK